MTEITAQNLTIKKNQGITQALLKLVKNQKMTMSDGSISRDEWNSTVDKIAEIQQAHQKDNKPSIFTGGAEKTDWHKNFVTNPDQKIEFTKEEMESLYKTMGVSFDANTVQGNRNSKTTPRQVHKTTAKKAFVPSDLRDKKIVSTGSVDGNTKTTFDDDSYIVKFPAGNSEVHYSGNRFIESYSKDNKLVQKSYLNKNGSLSCVKEFNLAGNITKNTEYYDNKTIKEISEYNAAEKVTQKTLYDENGEVVRKFKNEYDKSDRITKQTCYNKNNEVSNVWVIEHCSAGNTKSIDYDANGKIVSMKEYDKNDTLIKQAVYD